MKKSFVILLLLAGFWTNLFGQTERLSYKVYYNWGFIWINGGTLTLSSQPDTLEGIPVVRLDGVGKTLPRWDWLFKVDDHYTSWCYPGNYLPVLATKNTLEGGYRINNNYRFDYDKSVAYIRTEETRKPLEQDTVHLNYPMYDAMAATNKLRFYNFDAFTIGDTISLSIIMDGIIHRQKIVYAGLDTLLMENKQRISAIKFTAIVTDNKLFSADDAIKVWVSYDKKRIPLYIEANITVGAIKIYYF